jgi:hypothetical protein
MVKVPLRAAPLLAATAYVTVWLPNPLLPEDIAIKPELLTALHPHVDVAMTFTVPVPPADPNDWLGAESE